MCEKRGCWIDGEVADCEGAASAICRVQFDRDGLAEDSVRIRSTPKDLDLLEKMVKLGRVRPGARVNIYRPEDDSFYPAMVLQERLQNRKAFFVQYDDGESEWINLWFHKFEVLSDGPVRKKPKTIAKETSRHGSKDSILKKTKGEKDAKGSERLKTTISKGLEKLTAPHVVGRTPPEEVLHSMNSTSLQEGAKNEKPDPYLVNKKDTDKSCRSRKEEVKDSHNWSISLTRTRGRNDAAITKAKDEDENANVSAAETRIESASARKTDKKKVKKTETCVTEKTAIGDVKLTESKRGCPRILEVVSRDTLISSNIETKPVDFISNSSTLTESKRGRPRKSDTVAREPLMSCNTEKKSAIEVNSESDNIDFMPPKESGTKLRTKGKRSDTDLCDTDSVQSNDLEVEDKVTKSHREKEVAVGDRVGIYWEGDKKYYYGKVTKHEKGKKKPFFLEYDDDDSEWIDFSKSTYRFEKKKKIPVTPNVTDKSSPSIGTIVKSKHDKSKADAALIQPPLRTMRRSMNVTEAMNATELYTDTRKKRSPLVDQAPSTRKKQKVSTDTDFTDLIANEVAKIKVGTRVAVFWPDDNRYYKGVVSRKQPEATWRPFFLEYDDGEEEWIDFRQHKFKILPVVADEERAVSSAGKADYPCSDPSKVWIGTRLSVWWPREEEYFECTVTRYRDHKRSFYLEYEDGDREWIDLAEHKFFIIENGSSERRRAGTRTRSL